MGEKVLAASIASPYRLQITETIKTLKASGKQAPLLVGILANDDPAARKYAEWTGQAFRDDGLRYEVREVKDVMDVEKVLQGCNDDPSIHGIIVYYPIFGLTPTYSGTSHDDFLRDMVSPEKDVEGLSHLYRSNMYRDIRFMDEAKTLKCLLPCTSLSVVKILEACGNYNNTLSLGKRMAGQTVSIINRSEIVGRPLAAMLANDGSDVFSIDIDSIYRFRDGKCELLKKEDGWDVEKCVRLSTAVITGVPVKAYKLTSEWVNEGCTVINVASFKNVEEAEILKIKDVKYVGLVGKVTVAMLERNLIRLFEQYHDVDCLIKREIIVEEKEKVKVNVGLVLQGYTAVAITLLVAWAFNITRRHKK